MSIAITPYLFYLYESFPEGKTWETFLFTYSSDYYQNIYTVAWLVTGKLIPLLLLLIWFFTCKHWWYHVILIPTAMYLFQLINIFNDDIRFVDEVEIYWLIPIMMLVIPFVYLIRLKLFDKYVNGIDLKQIDKEIKEYETKAFLRKYYNPEDTDIDKFSA